MEFKTQTKPLCSDYYCSEHNGTVEVVSSAELMEIKDKYLEKFNTTSLGINSKVYFLEHTDFPRYRLRDYGKDKNITIVRNIEKADYVSEIKKIKHPYDKGILAREGVEY